jgi:hypothetical protein
LIYTTNCDEGFEVKKRNEKFERKDIEFGRRWIATRIGSWELVATKSSSQTLSISQHPPAADVAKTDLSVVDSCVSVHSTFEFTGSAALQSLMLASELFQALCKGRCQNLKDRKRVSFKAKSSTLLFVPLHLGHSGLRISQSVVPSNEQLGQSVHL